MTDPPDCHLSLYTVIFFYHCLRPIPVLCFEWYAKRLTVRLNFALSSLCSGALRHKIPW